MAKSDDIDPTPFNVYQSLATSTAIYPEAGTGSISAVMYCALGLASEAGEIAGKIKKLYRDQGGVITPDDALRLRAEIGDVLWYPAVLLNELGLLLGDAAKENVDKLESRMQRGVLGGSGDNR